MADPGRFGESEKKYTEQWSSKGGDDDGGSYGGGFDEHRHRMRQIREEAEARNRRQQEIDAAARREKARMEAAITKPPKEEILPITEDKDTSPTIMQTIMGGGEGGDPTITKKSWEAAGKVPTGQHKLRTQFDRLIAKYGEGFANTTQGRELLDYLSGVPVERGGGLGARDPGYGGGSFATKSGKINKNLEAQRQALIKRISSIGTPWGGDMSTMLEDIKREGIGADLTPDQFFNFTQQLMAADPSPGNQAYKAARPFASGQLAQGVMSLAPGMGPLKAIAKGVGSFAKPALDIAEPAISAIKKPFQGISDWFKFNPPAEYMGMTADPNFLRRMQGRPIAPSVRPDGDRGGVIDAAQSVVNQQSPYGGWIGTEDQMHTGDWVDRDGDGVDDRWQTGPGQPNQGPGQGADLKMPGFGPINPPDMPGGPGFPHPITLPQAPFSGQTDLAASQAAGYDIPIGGGQDPNFQDWYKNLGIMQNVYS